ncbi:MAG: branched-chain amino acid ABC transporter permease, partial [Solirubrobacteraceae bacterium]
MTALDSTTLPQRLLKMWRSRERLPMRRSLRVLGWLCVAAFASAPFWLNSSYDTDVFCDMALWAAIGLGLNVVIGFAGLLDLGYMAFYAFGGYTFATLSLHLGLSLWEAIPIGTVFAGLASAVFGFPTLRLRGDYLAIMTLGFGGIVDIAANNLSLTGGADGLYGMPQQSVFGYTLSTNDVIGYYVLALALVAVAGVATHRFRHSKIGRAWTCVKDDELAAAASGIRVTRCKLQAYVLGAIWAGVAGAIFAAKQGLVSPETFTFDQSFFAVAIVVLGGMGSIPGVVLGAVLYVVISEYFQGVTGTYSGLIFSILLLLVVLVRPRGLIPYRPRRRRGTPARAAPAAEPAAGLAAPAVPLEDFRCA